MAKSRTTTRGSRRSVCPVACALDIFGDKWTLLVIRDLACGKRLFKEFAQSPEGIASNILSDRLQRLVDHGLVIRVPGTHLAGRDAYELTEKGETLLHIVRAIAEWGQAHLPGTEARMRFAKRPSGRREE
ncbi:MAG: winged helix-turn-helix transcriptional regulator [Pirellulaceae bacterium]